MRSSRPIATIRRRRRPACRCIAGSAAAPRAAAARRRRRRPACPRAMVVSDRGHAGVLARRPQGLRARWRRHRGPRRRTISRRTNACSSICGTGRTTSIQPMQRVRANQERNRTYRGVYRSRAGQVRAARRPVVADGHAQRRRHARDRHGRCAVSPAGRLRRHLQRRLSAGRQTVHASLLHQAAAQRRRTGGGLAVVTRRQVRVLLPGQAVAPARRRRADDARRDRLVERRVPRRRR